MLPYLVAGSVGTGTALYGLVPMLEEAKNKTPDVKKRQDRMDKVKESGRARETETE